MKLTELEAERLRHLETRKQLARLNAALLERDEVAVGDAIRARLGLTGPLSVAADGTVTGATAAEDGPAQ